MTQQPAIIRCGRAVGKSTSLQAPPRFSQKLVDVNGDPLEIPQPQPQRRMEFYAWAVVGMSLPPLVEQSR